MRDRSKFVLLIGSSQVLISNASLSASPIRLLPFHLHFCAENKATQNMSGRRHHSRSGTGDDRRSRWAEQSAPPVLLMDPESTWAVISNTLAFTARQQRGEPDSAELLARLPDDSSMNLSDQTLATKIDLPIIADKFSGPYDCPLGMDLHHSRDANGTYTNSHFSLDTTRIVRRRVVSELVGETSIELPNEPSKVISGELRIWPDFGGLSSKDFGPGVTGDFARYVASGGDPLSLRLAVDDVRLFTDRPVTVGEAFGTQPEGQHMQVLGMTHAETFASTKSNILGTAALCLVWGIGKETKVHDTLSQPHPLGMRLHFHPSAIQPASSSKASTSMNQEGGSSRSGSQSRMSSVRKRLRCLLSVAEEGIPVVPTLIGHHNDYHIYPCIDQASPRQEPLSDSPLIPAKRHLHNVI